MIKVVQVKDKKEGNLKAHDILKDIVDSKTLLVLSGGTSPDYRLMIVEGADILPGAICVVDERYGEPFHPKSNELLLKNAGVFDFAKEKSFELYKILSGKQFLETERDYDRVIVDLFDRFSGKVGVMGVGTNLHTAGVFPYSAAAKFPNFVVAETVEDKQSLRSSSLRTAGLEFPQRITLTLRALGEFENFIILAFGKEKRQALRIILDEGENDIQKYPAIFYRKCPAKSWLVTDIIN